MSNTKTIKVNTIHEEGVDVDINPRRETVYIWAGDDIVLPKEEAIKLANAILDEFVRL